jgi:hypothetical protein
MNTSEERVPRGRRTREAVERLVSEFKASDLPAGEFCRRHGLAPSTWRRTLNRAGAGSAPGQPGVRFVAVKLNGAAAKPAPAALEVVLAGGGRLGVAPGFDEGTLGRLIRLLEGL